MNYITPEVAAILDSQPVAAALEKWIKSGPDGAELGRVKAAIDCMDIIGKAIAREATFEQPNVVGLFDRSPHGWHPSMGRGAS